jgi:N-acetylneuraminate synthase/N,N'-diacetyllegionaminate synthase
MQIRIGNKKIGDNAPTFIIAEIGTNHNGKLELAVEMIKEDAKVGVDALKLQVVNPDESYVKGSTSYNIFKRVYLDFNALKKLKYETEKRGMIFFATAGDLSSLNLLLRLKAPLIKISSGCMTNVSLLRKAARTGIPIIISTGMAYMQEVKKAVLELEKNGAKDIALLHCVSQYPAEYEELNLNSIKTLQSQFRYPIGFSDHTKDNLASLVAVSIGAKIIEKHFTHDKRLRGPEHHFSIEPGELKQLVKNIRDVEKIMGSCAKRPTAVEKKSRNGLRRFLVFAGDLAKGAVIREHNITAKRLIKGAGLSPEYYDRVIGKKTVSDVKRNGLVKFSLLR